MAQAASPLSKRNGQHQNIGQLGPLLCWAVVFADIGSSIYYVPGILYGRVGNLAGFFVLLTMSVLGRVPPIRHVLGMSVLPSVACLTAIRCADS